MATMDQLERALIRAHNAGDAAAAKVLATEIRRQRAGSAQPQSKPDPSMGMAPDISASMPDAAIGQPGVQGNPNNWGTLNQATDFVTMGGSTKLGAAGTALLDAGLGAIQGNGWDFSGAYDRNLSQARADQEAYANENPIRAALGTGAGVALGVTSLPIWGRGVTGALGTGATYGGIGGALQDAESVSERAGNTLLGGLAGAGIGAGGYGIGKGAGYLLGKAGDVATIWRAPPEVKAASEFYKAADDTFGPNNAMSMSRKLAELGPDAVNADVLGKRGYAMGRGAANISPDARQTLEDVVSARKQGQNTRLAGDVEAAAGLPAGNTKNVDALKKEAYDKLRPQITAAYNAARKAGYDIPLDLFDNIITTPVGVKAFRQALDNITSRAARNPKAGGNLAVLDETKRLLDGWAKQAFRASDPMAGEYADTAKALRSAVDNFLASGNEYATARGLRQQAYKADEAFDLGAELGGRSVDVGLPGKVAKVDPPLRRNVARAYGVTKVQSLLNKNSTEGAFNDLITPQGKKAAQAALGNKQAGLLGKAIDREKLFNTTNREIVGNSSTARQLIEAGGTGLGTAAVGTLLGYDPTTSTAAGIMAGIGRRAAPIITRRMVTEGQKKVAPKIAELLVAQGLPTNQPIPVSQLATIIQRYLTAGDAKMAKTLALMWNGEVQNTNRQTNAEK